MIGIGSASGYIMFQHQHQKFINKAPIFSVNTENLRNWRELDMIIDRECGLDQIPRLHGHIQFIDHTNDIEIEFFNFNSKKLNPCNNIISMFSNKIE